MKSLNIIKSLTSHMSVRPRTSSRYASKRLVMTLPIPRLVLLSLPLLSLFLTANVQAQDVTAPDAPVFTTLNGTVDITGSTATQYTNSLPFTLSGTAEAGSTVEVFDLRRAPGPRRTLVKGNLPLASATADSTTGVWTVSISAESERGAFVATATDAADNTSVDSSRVYITLDNTPPALPFISTTTQTVSAAAFTLTGTASGTSDTINVLKGGTLIHSGIPVTSGASAFVDNTWSIDVTLTPGANVFTATATDRAGNTSGATAAVTITLDVANPTATITSTSGASGASVSADSLRYTVTFGAAAVTGFALSNITVTGTANSGSPVASNLQGTGASYTFDVAKGNSDGTVIVSIAANQVSNNLASNQLTLTIDTTPPSVAITTTSQETATALFTIQGTITSPIRPLNPGSVSSGIVTVHKAGSDEALIAGFSPSGAWAIEVDLEQGDNTFTATATDGAGNTSGATAAVIITRVAPSVTITSVSPPGGTGLRLDDDDTKQQRRLKYRVAFSGETVARAHDFTPSDITVTGTANGGSPVADSVGAEVTEAGRFLGYTFEVKRGSSDGTVTVSIPAGAIGNSPASNELTLTIDTTPPSVAITTAGQTVNTLPFTIEGTAEAGALIQLLRGAALSVIATTTAAADGTWAIPFDLTVTPNGGAQNREVPSVINSMRVSAIDGAGNIALSNYANISVRTRAPDISVSSNMLIATIGTPITPIIIINDGGAVSATGAYSISPNINERIGLDFNTSTGEISGTPTRVANEQAYSITYTTTTGDEFFVTPSSATVTITVNAVAPNISIQNTLIANVGTAITPIAAINTGGPVTSYSISLNLNGRTGLDFNTSTGTISGTPTRAVNAQAYTITATNSGGTNDATVTITVNAAAPMISASMPTLIATQAVAITPITITNTGGPVTSYGIDPDLPAGLLIDASDGSISGIPAMASNAQAYTITATNTVGGNSSMATITITITVIAAVPNITIIPSTLTATQFVAITPTTIRSIGGAATSYSISPPIANGLSFNTNTGSISGTPTMAADAVTYTITAENTGGMDDATITITVNAAAPMISINPATVTAIAGVAITPPSITSSGGDVASYSIDPAIGNGLSFDTSTGTISGTPTAVADAVTYTITATNTADDDTASVTITVNAVAPDISIDPSTLTATVGTAIPPITIVHNGGAVVSYSISPPIANGLSFNTNTGSISGTPTAVAGAETYTITATNSAGADTASVTITVNAALTVPIISATHDVLNAGVGIEITPITIINNGGAVASYSIDPDLSPGLLFDTNTGTISGTPTATFRLIVYTITATNSIGDGTTTVSISVSAAPDISASRTTLIATQAVAIPPITIINNGGAVASYSISPPIANGLSFNTNTGSISGTPTAVAVAVTYTITATGVASTSSAMVTITVNATLAAPDIIPSVTALTATQAAAITPITIDASAGGAVDSYSISPNLPAGLSIDTDTGSISGIPASSASVQTYTITATNTAGSDTASVTITVNSVPIIAVSPRTLFATVGTAITPTTIMSTGGPVTGYGIRPAAANGLSFDTTTGSISGTPTMVAGRLTYSIFATNAPDVSFAGFFITVVDAPDISPSVPTLTATVGTAIPPITIAHNGGAVASYSINPDLPAGLSIDTSTGEISGTPTVTSAVGTVTYTITANGIGIPTVTDTASVEITVNAAPITAPIISINPSTLTANVGTAITPTTIMHTGGPVTSYAIGLASNGQSLNANTGLSFNTANGMIFGTPTMVAGAETYTITATNSAGMNSAMVTITVNAAAPSISASLSTLAATAGTTIADITITNNGGAVPATGAYSISPAIGNGLSFNANTGSISGTPTAVAEAVTYIITATNSAGMNSAMVTITVNAALAAPSISASLSTLAATTATAIADITIENNGGAVPATGAYSISPAIGNGLSFNANTGSISGTPTAVADAVTYIITATNSAGMNSAMVTITVNAALAAPSISASLSTLAATTATAIADITIENNGGAVPATGAYSISPAIGNGLSFNANTGSISGTPTAVAEAVTYIITATNSAGMNSAMVTITVNAALAAPSISASLSTLAATTATAIADITIENNGGAVPATGAYSISPAIGNGLSFNANTGSISGTPTAVANAVTYIITATNSAGMNSAMVTITVNATLAAPSISASLSTLAATAGTTIADITITNNGGAVPATGAYSISPAIGNGLSFDANTGSISGTPTAVAEAVAYIITATNSAGMNSAMVTITVNAALAAPSISASLSTLAATTATAIADITIENNGGAVPATGAYSISPAIGNGLSFNANTGSISGTPTAVANAVTYIITATNSAGMNSAMVTITVNAALAAPSISASLSTLAATTATAIADITIENNGGAVPATGAYSISPAIGNGLSFNANTGSISGTPTAVAEAVTYIITATNSAGMNSAMVTITVNAALAAPSISASLSTLAATTATAIADITIENNGGAVPATGAYSISPAIGNGLSFNANTGSISGTPTAVANAVTYIITATNSAGMNSAMVTITVNATLAAPSISASLVRWPPPPAPPLPISPLKIMVVQCQQQVPTASAQPLAMDSALTPTLAASRAHQLRSLRQWLTSSPPLIALV